jgi:uncharacterized protein
MVCEPTMKLIGLMNVQPDGAGYVAKDGYNLVASFRRMDVPGLRRSRPRRRHLVRRLAELHHPAQPDPEREPRWLRRQDGCRWCAREPDLRDHARGRIYRIVWDKSGAAVKAAQGESSDEAPRRSLLVARSMADSAPSG